MPLSGAHKRIWPLLWLDAALALFALSARWLTALMMRVLPECAFARRGISCPACGGTRCIASLFRGEFGAAFAYNPVIFLFLVYLLILIGAWHLSVWFGVRRAAAVCRSMTHHRAAIAFAVVFVAFGFWRNLS